MWCAKVAQDRMHSEAVGDSEEESCHESENTYPSIETSLERIKIGIQGKLEHDDASLYVEKR